MTNEEIQAKALDHALAVHGAAFEQVAAEFQLAIREALATRLSEAASLAVDAGNGELAMAIYKLSDDVLSPDGVDLSPVAEGSPLQATLRNVRAQAIEEAASILEGRCWCAGQYKAGEWRGQHDKDCPAPLAAKIRALKPPPYPSSAESILQTSHR